MTGPEVPEDDTPQLLVNQAVEVEKYHRHDDLDSSPMAHHHSLGSQPNQAAPGNHEHGIKLDCAMYRSSAQSISNAAWTNMVCDKFNYRDRNVLSFGGAYVAVVDGWYNVSAGVSFLAAAGGGTRLLRMACFDANNNPISQSFGRDKRDPGAGSADLSISTKAILLAGQYVIPQVYQNSGAALNTLYLVNGSDTLSCWFNVALDRRI